MAVWKFISTLKKLCRPRHLSPFLQNGEVYLAEILYGVLIWPWNPNDKAAGLQKNKIQSARESDMATVANNS